MATVSTKLPTIIMLQSSNHVFRRRDYIEFVASIEIIVTYDVQKTSSQSYSLVVWENNQTRTSFDFCRAFVWLMQNSAEPDNISTL